MKKLFYLFTILFAVVFAACEGTEPPTSNKVETGASENITQTSATLKGAVNVDIAAYNSVEFGIMYDTLLAEVNNRSAQMVKASVLQGKDFKVDVTGLTANAKYYYCAYLLLNGMQYEYGAVKEFTTQSASFVAKPFSVSVSKTVTFSPGNLQYHAANNEWRFAPSQTDYIGEANANISSTYNGWIDLFGWGTGNNPTNIDMRYDYSPSFDDRTFVDWGVNRIGSYAPNTWRTLTYDEWEYITNGRPNADKLIGIAQVNGVNGLILLPDGWICPSGVAFKSGFNYKHVTDMTEYLLCYPEHQTFCSSEWSKLQASGAVFLPAAGYRYGYDIIVMQIQSRYWTVTEELSSTFDFSPGGVSGTSCPRSGGCSVRLVQD